MESPGLMAVWVLQVFYGLEKLRSLSRSMPSLVNAGPQIPESSAALVLFHSITKAR